MDYKVIYAETALRDLDTISDHLFETYCAFDDSVSDADQRAAIRIGKILENGFRIGTAPFRGQDLGHLRSGLRQLTLDKTVYYFEIDQDLLTVRIIALFFGGQDHQRQMLVRMLSRPSA